MSGLFELDTDGARALDEQARLNPLDLSQVQPQWWDNAGPAAGQGIFRGGARMAHLLQAPLAVASDKLYGTGHAQQDRLFGSMDDVVDFWTPNPATTGTAGQIAGGFAEIVLPMLASGGNPAVAAGTTSLTVGGGAATDLVRQGVDADTAMAVGGVHAAANLIGFRIPFFGRTLTQRMLGGAGANLAIEVPAGLASEAVLDAEGFDAQAEQYGLTKESGAVATLAGLAFGAFAHVGAPRATQAQRDAVLAANNAEHFAAGTLPGAPQSQVAAAAHVDALAASVGQLLRGERVDVASTLRLDDFQLRPELRMALPANEPGASVPAAGYDAFRHALESGGRADAAAPTSGAFGVDQFIPSTWRAVVEKAKPAWAEGLSDAELLAARGDPAKSAEMEAVLRAENAAALEGAGLDPTPVHLYAAHHFGADKGVAFARAADDTPVTQILAAGQIKANPYLRGMTKAQVVENWTARAERAGAGVRRAFADPDQVATEQFVGAARERAVPEAVARELAPKAPRDSVTGFFDGRQDRVKTELLSRAQDHVRATGEPGMFVSADLFNLGGLNEHFGNRAEAANVHYRAMAQMLEAALRETGADVVPMRTGGDEFGMVVINADREAVRTTVARAQAQVEAYARTEQLSEIPHPKRADERGVGLHVGVADIAPGAPLRAILDDADAGMARTKGGAAQRVDGDLEALRQEIGWEQRGGELVRAAPDESTLNAEERSGIVAQPRGEVSGRTSWVPKPGPNGEPSHFWRNRPDPISEADALRIMDKHAAGERLGAREQRFIDYARRVADSYAADRQADAKAFQEDVAARSEAERVAARQAHRDEAAAGELEAGGYDAARAAAAAMPDLAILDDDGNLRPAAEVLSEAQALQQQAELDSRGTQAAVDCYLWNAA